MWKDDHPGKKETTGGRTAYIAGNFFQILSDLYINMYPYLLKWKFMIGNSV